MKWFHSEAAIPRGSVKKLLIKISQNSQENTFVSSHFDLKTLFSHSIKITTSEADIRY